MKISRISFSALTIIVLLAIVSSNNLNARIINNTTTKPGKISQLKLAPILSNFNRIGTNNYQIIQSPAPPVSGDMPPTPNWFNWVSGIISILGIIGLIVLLATWIKTRVWRFRSDRAEIEKCKKILENSIARHLVNKKLKVCIDIKDELIKEQHNEELEKIVRVSIEHYILEGKLLKSTELKDKIKSNSIQIQLGNCFEFYEEEKQNKIKEYLKYILDTQANKNQDAKFYCPVKFTDGFLCPLYLIAGPLRYFHDAWPKMIHEYNLAIEATINLPFQSIRPSVRAIQSSIFTTWIAWGPSIPICKCSNEWAHNHHDRSIAIQYGFGDENNSIPILLQPGEHIDGELELIFQNRNYGQLNIVRQATITARPVLLSKETRETKIAIAQTELIDPTNTELVLQLEKKLSSVYTENLVEYKSTGSVNYYTAYVWILFAVKHKDRPNEFQDCINQNTNQTTIWRQLLPFYEHVNIADASSYEAQKKALAYKTLNTLNDLYSQDNNLHFEYLCAFDHCNCYNPDTQQENGSFISTNKKIIDFLKELIVEKQANGEQIPLIDIDNLSPLPAHKLPSLIDKMNKFIDSKNI